MRKPGAAVLVVDGSNVGHSVEPRLTDRRVLDLVLQYAAADGADVIAVFDGDGPVGAPGRTTHGPRCVVIACGADSADPVIEQEARRAADAGRQVLVCTADRAIRDTVAGPNIRVIGPAELLGAVVAADALADPQSQPEVEGATSRLGTLVDGETAQRLEALRRASDES